jgi:RNA polymerase-interacting CarD/CdnL/TRCF family regulator
MHFLRKSRQLEEKTRRHYKELARKCAYTPGIKNILEKLSHNSDEIIKCLNKIMKDKEWQFENKKLFQKAQNLLETLKNEKDTFSCSIKQKRLYEKALEFALKKKTFYEYALINRPQRREIILKLLAGQKKQIIFLENIIEMLEKPDYWVENAEFTHLNEDY